MESVKSNAVVTAFFEEASCTASYVIADLGTSRCVIIDPVLDYQAESAHTGTQSADRLVDHVIQNGLSVDWVLETHVHADHFTAAAYLKRRLGGSLGIGAGVAEVQRTISEIFNLAPDATTDGFDRKFDDGERITFGESEFEVMFTPGHTPACVCYRVGDAIFVGDTLFMPDSGTARCDFPGGDAATLFKSIRRILSLPGNTMMYLCHNYGGDNSRAHKWVTDVATQRTHNIHVRDGVTAEEFIALRNARDATLALPHVMLPAIQVNIRAGRFPAPENNGCLLYTSPSPRDGLLPRMPSSA